MSALKCLNVENRIVSRNFILEFLDILSSHFLKINLGSVSTVIAFDLSLYPNI